MTFSSPLITAGSSLVSLTGHFAIRPCSVFSVAPVQKHGTDVAGNQTNHRLHVLVPRSRVEDRLEPHGRDKWELRQRSRSRRGSRDRSEVTFVTVIGCEARRQVLLGFPQEEADGTEEDEALSQRWLLHGGDARA